MKRKENKMPGEKRKIRFGLVILSAVFLWNPFMATLDLLPDFIGLLILCASLSPLCEINEHFVEAQRGFYKAMYVSLARFALSSFMTFKNFLSNDTFTLLFLFVFSLLNVIFVIPALNSLKKGLQYLPMYGASKVIDKPAFKRFGTTKNDFVYVITVVFAVVHSMLSIFPEFFTLNSSDKFGNINYDALKNHGYFRAISFFTLLLIGVLWFVIICVYFAKICRDRQFVDALEKKYVEKVYLHENSLLQRELKKGTTLIFFASVCSLDIFIDGLNLLPNFISSVLMLFAVFTLKNYISCEKRKRNLCIIATVSSIVKTVAEFIFIDKYSYLKVPYNEAARNAYIILSAANLLDSIMHLVIIYIAVSILRRIIKDHTGFSLQKGTDHENDPKIKELHKSFYSRLTPIWIFALLRTGTSVFYYVSKLFSEWYFELAFSYHLIVCVIFVFLTAALIKKINEEISYKYMLA